MTPFKTRFEYHGSKLVEASWTGGADLQLTIDLDGQWNSGLSLRIRVLFHGVGNRAEVEEALAKIASPEAHEPRTADITALRKTPEDSFQLDTSQGPLVIDASSFAEV